MKTSLNSPAAGGSEDWLNELLTRIKPVASGAIPSANLDRRCVLAVTSALKVAQMQPYRQSLASAPGSLAEHFQALAQKAGVKLEAVFETLGITSASLPNAGSARGLARLARHLGLTRNEAILRLRWGFAQLAGAIEPGQWSGAFEPARVRRRRGAGVSMKNLDESLRRCEAAYSEKGRAGLRVAIHSFAEVYEQEMT